MSTVPTPQDDEQHHDVEAEARPKRPPYAQMPHYVLNHPDLSPGDRELYAHLDTFWRDKDECWPSKKKLAARMGVDESTAYRRTRKLEAAKLIEVRRQGLTRPNTCRRLPPPRPNLHAVLNPDDAGQAPPDRASAPGLDSASLH